MAEYNLGFSSSFSQDKGSFRLLELPPDLCQLIESAAASDNPLSFTIKGQPNDDAVLCTADKTYALRSVVLSNSVLVVTAPSTNATSNSTLGDAPDVVIRDQLNEILELVPSVPRLHRLVGLLKGMEYDEGREEEQLSSDDDNDTQRPNKRRKFTYKEAQVEIQASDAELARGLKERRILNIDGHLHPINPSYLNAILELLLNYLVSLSLPHNCAPVEELTATLADEHEIPRQVSTQVMSWFGEIHEDKWIMNVDAVLKEIGLGILREHKDSIAENEFLAKWRTSVGDTFETSVSLSLLSGNYLASPSLTGGEVLEHILQYYPASSLPVDPASRFADLFLTRSRWKGDDIAPFLADIAINSKERDKLLLKFARATTDTQGVWYTARAQYNG